MNFLKIQKKHKKQVILRSSTLLWIIINIFILIYSNVYNDLSKEETLISKNLMKDFCPNKKNITTIDKVMKNNYEIEDDSPCKINFCNTIKTSDNIYTMDFDDNIKIQNTVIQTSDGSINNFKVFTKSDNVNVGITREFSSEPSLIPQVVKKVLCKKDYSVYYFSSEKLIKGRSNYSTIVFIVFNDGKIKVLHEKDFTDDFSKEKDENIKNIKLLIMKNEISKFFDSTMFMTSFKGLSNLKEENEAVNKILSKYANNEKRPKNIENYSNTYLKSFINKQTFNTSFNESLHKVLYINGSLLTPIVFLGYDIDAEKPDVIEKRYNTGYLNKTGNTYDFKDLTFVYNENKLSPKLLKIIVNRPIFFCNTTQLINKNLDDVKDKFKGCVTSNDFITEKSDGTKEIYLMNNWTLIIDSNNIIKSAIHYSTY